MGQKTSPILLRLGLNQSWQSDWYPYKNSGAIGARANNYFQNLHQDLLARTYLDIVYTKLRAPTTARDSGPQSAEPGAATETTKDGTIVARLRRPENFVPFRYAVNTASTFCCEFAVVSSHGKKNKTETKTHNLLLDIKFMLFLVEKVFALRKSAHVVGQTILEFAWKTPPFSSGAESRTKNAAFMHTPRRNFCRRKSCFDEPQGSTPDAIPTFDPFVEQAESVAEAKAIGAYSRIKQHRKMIQSLSAASLFTIPLLRSLRLRLLRLHQRQRHKGARVWSQRRSTNGAQPLSGLVLATPAVAYYKQKLKLSSPEIRTYMREVTDLMSKLYWIKYKSGWDMNRTLAKKNLYYAKTKAFSLMMVLLLRPNAARQNPQGLPCSSRDALTYTQNLVFDGLANSWMENLLPPALSSYTAQGRFPIWRRKLLSLAIWRRFLFKMGEQEQDNTNQKNSRSKNTKKKRNKAYKHFILNTIIKSLSNAIYTKFDKGPRVNDLGYSIAQANLLCLPHKGTNFVSLLDHPLDLYACIYKRIMASSTVPSSANGSLRRWDSRNAKWHKLQDICFGGFKKSDVCSSELAQLRPKPRTYHPGTVPSPTVRPKNVSFVRTPAGRTLFPRQHLFGNAALYVQHTLEIFCAIERNLNVCGKTGPKKKATCPDVLSWVPLQKGLENLNLLTYLYYLYEWNRPSLPFEGEMPDMSTFNDSLRGEPTNKTVSEGFYNRTYWDQQGTRQLTEQISLRTLKRRSKTPWTSQGLKDFKTKTFRTTLNPGNSKIEQANFASPAPSAPVMTKTENKQHLWAFASPPFVFADSDKISGNFVFPRNIRKRGDMSLGPRKTYPIFCSARFGAPSRNPEWRQKNTTLTAPETAESAAKTASQGWKTTAPDKGRNSATDGLRRRKLVSLSGARQYFIKKSRNTLSIDIHTRVPKGRKHPDRAAFCTMLLQQRFAKTHEPSSPNQKRGSETNSAGQLLERHTTTQPFRFSSSSTGTVFVPLARNAANITKPRPNKKSRQTLQRILFLMKSAPSGPRQRMRMLVVFGGKRVKAEPTPLLSSCEGLRRIKAGAERFQLAGIRLLLRRRLHILFRLRGSINSPTQQVPPKAGHSDTARNPRPSRKCELADILRLQSPKQRIPFLLQEAKPLLCHTSRKANINALQKTKTKTKSADGAMDCIGHRTLVGDHKPSAPPKPRTRPTISLLSYHKSGGGTKATMNKNIYAPCPSLNWGTYPLAFRGDSVLGGGAQLRPALSSLPFVSPVTASRHILERSSLHLSSKSSKHQVQENGRHFFLSEKAEAESVPSRARAFQDFSESPQFGIIIKHHHSKSYNASFLVQNLSKFVIAFLKKNRSAKNKFQQLKNIASRILVASTSSASAVSSFPDALGGDGTKKPNGPLSPFFSLSRFDTKMQETSLPNAVNPSKGSGAYGIRKKNPLGVAFRFAGRAYGAKKAASFKMLVGSTPFNTLRTNMDYAQITQKTRNGTWGFKIWLNLGRKNTINVLSLLGTRRTPSASSRSVHTQTLAKAFAKKKTRYNKTR